MANQACSLYSPQVQVPSQWALPDFTDAACAAPDCGDNRAAFETCCGQAIVSFNATQSARGNTTADGSLTVRQDQPDSLDDLLYLVCRIGADTSTWDPLSTESSPYLDYQNCLINAGSQYFKCNTPRGSTLSGCPVGFQSAPAGEGEMTCSTRNSPDATAALGACCESDLQVYGYGCYTYCSGESGLQQCVENNSNNYEGPAIFCRASNDTSDDTSEEATQGGSDGNNDTSGAPAFTRRTTNTMGCVAFGLLLVHMLY